LSGSPKDSGAAGAGIGSGSGAGSAVVAGADSVGRGSRMRRRLILLSPSMRERTWRTGGGGEAGAAGDWVAAGAASASPGLRRTRFGFSARRSRAALFISVAVFRTGLGSASGVSGVEARAGAFLAGENGAGSEGRALEGFGLEGMRSVADPGRAGRALG